VNFFLDQDVPFPVGEVLRQEGHSVVRLAEVLPVDAKDKKVFDYARDHQRTLITCNRDDFLKLVAGQTHSGLIILIRRRSRPAESSALLRLVRKAGDAGILNNVNFA